MFMLMEDQFGVGDVVDTGVAGASVVTGTVEGVSLRTTRLRDIDGVVWHVPNGAILRVGNKSQQWSRAVVDVPVTFETDTGAATEVIRDGRRRGLARPRVRLGDPGRADRARRRVVGARTGGDPGRRAHPAAGAVARSSASCAVRIKAALDEAGIALPSV